MKITKSLMLVLLLTITIMLTGMTLYEFTKQIIFPNILIWESHIITIVFSSIIATIASFFVYRNRQKILNKLHIENIERKKTQESLKKALDEKNLLIMEINHRVKNNFQLVSSIIGLEKSRITDKKSLMYFNEVQNRIRTMVLIHESFQQSETDEFSTIEFSDFIRKVANNLYRIYVIDPSKVKLKIDAERIYLEIKQAIATGLILNELLTNSFKYAFDYNKDHNEVSVSFKILENNIIELIVSDNGKGIPYDLNTMTFNSLGLQIVKSLSEDHLDGNIELDRQGGTKFIITFRKREIIIK